MQTKIGFDLKSYSYNLLGRGFFYSEQEKNLYAVQLEQVMNELIQIHTELMYLEHDTSITCLINEGADTEEVEIVRLIRRIRNRLKVLPAEPLEPFYAYEIERAVIHS